jgi:hypothetical protein
MQPNRGRPARAQHTPVHQAATWAWAGKCPSRLSRCVGPLDRGRRSRSDCRATFSANKTSARRWNPSSFTLSPSHSLYAATKRTERPVGVQPDERRERLGGWRARQHRRGSPRRHARSPLGGRVAAERSLGRTLPSRPADLRATRSTAATSPRPCARARLGERRRRPPQRPTE